MATERLPVQLAARVLGVSESGYYEWRGRAPSQRDIRHAWLTGLIRQAHADSRGTYGARRVHAELVLGRGIRVGHGAVEMLMRRAAIAGITGRLKWRHAKPGNIACDLVDRCFSRASPNQLWVTDITEHPTREGKVYCCVVLDAYSRRVVGWPVDASPTAALVTSALGMAIDNRRPSAGALIHSDQGTQGGFNWSSQRLDREVCAWGDDQAGRRQQRGGRRCGRRDGRRWRGGSTGSGSGRRSRGALRARTLVLRPACRRRSGAGGSGNVAACRLRTSGRIRAVICRSSSVRRLRSAAPAGTGCGRSPGIWAARRRRSPGSCGETPEPVAARWSTGR